MGSCLHHDRGSVESQTKNHVHNNKEEKTAQKPTINAAGSAGLYSNSYTNNTVNKTSNTITITAMHSVTPPIGQRRPSIEDHKQILSDDDIFSREAIRVSHQFWNDNLLLLTSDHRQEISVTLYAQMFRAMPDCRKIFLRSDIESTSSAFLNMIGWLIKELNARNADVWYEIKKLGIMHSEWGITYEHFLPMLQAFHRTFQEKFPKAYTLRIKFCIENLFMNAAKIMTGKDFVTLFAERVQDLETLEFLDSLEACLAHKTGREYFERYLEQTFCAEFVIFLRFFDEFKQLGNTQQRFETAKEIYNTHFDINGRAPIEFNDDKHIEDIEILRIELERYQQFLLNQEMGNTQQVIKLAENLLNNVYANIKQIIEDQSWDKFQNGIYSIKTATQIHKK